MCLWFHATVLLTNIADFSSLPCCLMTAYTLQFIDRSSLNIAFFLGSLLFTHFRKGLCTCDFRLWTAMNTNQLPVLWLMRQYLFVTGNARRRICCLNIGNEELTPTILQVKPLGLGGEEGSRRAERSQLSFKI